MTVTSGRALGAMWFMNDLAWIHLTGQQVGGRVSVVEFLSPPGTMPPLHRHDREDELFYVVEGRRNARQLIATVPAAMSMAVLALG